MSIKEDGYSQLYTMEPDGSKLTRISKNNKENYYSPSWSPDGRKIVYASEKGSIADDIFIVNSDGNNKVNLTNDSASDSDPSWSPDGRKIVWVYNRGGFSEIYVMNSDGTNQTPLTSFRSAVLGPRWSPDGKYIVFASLKDQELWEIYIMKSKAQMLFD
jgi:Tol biopolymer transport system component